MTYSWCCCSQPLLSRRKAHSRLTSDSPGIGDHWWLAECSLIYLWVHPGGPHQRGRNDWHHFKASKALSLPMQLPYHVVQSQILCLNICNLRTQEAKAGELPQAESLPGSHSKTLGRKTKAVTAEVNQHPEVKSRTDSAHCFI